MSRELTTLLFKNYQEHWALELMLEDVYLSPNK